MEPPDETEVETDERDELAPEEHTGTSSAAEEVPAAPEAVARGWVPPRRTKTS